MNTDLAEPYPLAELTAVLSRWRRMEKLQRGLRWGLIGVFSLIFTVAWALSLATNPSTPGNSGIVGFPFVELLWVLVFPLWFIAVLPRIFHPFKRRLYADTYCSLRALSEDIRCVGPLIDSMSLKEPSVHKTVEAFLVWFLPKLDETAAGLLSRSQLDTLHRALLGSNDELVIATLGAVERIGDVSALPMVERLTVQAWHDPCRAPLSEAAERCRASLQQRLADALAPDLLLRASEPSADSTGLLRPAANNEPAAEGLLLRAAPRSGGE